LRPPARQLERDLEERRAHVRPTLKENRRQGAFRANGACVGEKTLGRIGHSNSACVI